MGEGWQISGPRWKHSVNLIQFDETFTECLLCSELVVVVVFIDADNYTSLVNICVNMKYSLGPLHTPKLVMIPIWCSGLRSDLIRIMTRARSLSAG